MAVNYGSDVSTFPDLDDSFAPLIGRSVTAERILRRLKTPRGHNPFHPDDGLDTREILHTQMTTMDLFRWEQAIVAEVEKDDAVYSAACSIRLVEGSTQAVTASIEVEDVEGPFDLTLSITELDVTFLQE